MQDIVGRQGIVRLFGCSRYRRINAHVRHRENTRVLSVAKYESDTCSVGIDLGTTNSAIAVIEGGRPVAVPNQEGSLTTPSVVRYLPDGNIVVGEAARRAAATAPYHTFHSVKRFIGQSFERVVNDAARVAFNVVSDENGSVSFQCGNEADAPLLSPEEVSSHVLAELLKAARRYTGKIPTRAVISVPAYFNDAQRNATESAGKLAGLEKIKIIHEPVAAALAYGLDIERDETVLVFDLGGGTFDVSLLEIGGGVIEVLSTGGDPHLGGDDWDEALSAWLFSKYLEPAGADCKSASLVASVRAVAEAAKISLSEQERVLIRMPIGDGIEAELSQQTFEGLTADLFRRARLPLDQACWQAGVDLGTALKDYELARKQAKKRGGRQGGQEAKKVKVDIRPKRRLPVSQVLLVGGATRMPAVQRFVKNMTGLEPKGFLVDPDLAVALGAAVQAGVYEGSVQDYMVLPVWQAQLMRAFAQKLEEDTIGEGDNASEEE